MFLIRGGGHCSKASPLRDDFDLDPENLVKLSVGKHDYFTDLQCYSGLLYLPVPQPTPAYLVQLWPGWPAVQVQGCAGQALQQEAANKAGTEVRTPGDSQSEVSWWWWCWVCSWGLCCAGWSDQRKVISTIPFSLWDWVQCLLYTWHFRYNDSLEFFFFELKSKFSIF